MKRLKEPRTFGELCCAKNLVLTSRRILENDVSCRDWKF